MVASTDWRYSASPACTDDTSAMREWDRLRARSASCSAATCCAARSSEVATTRSSIAAESAAPCTRRSISPAVSARHSLLSMV